MRGGRTGDESHPRAADPKGKDCTPVPVGSDGPPTVTGHERAWSIHAKQSGTAEIIRLCHAEAFFCFLILFHDRDGMQNAKRKMQNQERNEQTLALPFRGSCAFVFRSQKITI